MCIFSYAKKERKYEFIAASSVENGASVGEDSRRSTTVQEIGCCLLLEL